MKYSSVIPINKTWVTRMQSTHVIDDAYCMVSIGGGEIAASSIFEEYEFSLISCDLSEAFDPLYSTIPIPNGSLTISLDPATHPISNDGFYDQMYSRISTGMAVEVTLGYAPNGVYSGDGITRIGYIVSDDITVDVIRREITITFEHEITLLSDTTPFPNPYVVDTVVYELSTMQGLLPNTTLTGAYHRNVDNFTELDGSYLDVLTYYINASGSYFAFSNSGVLTLMSGLPSAYQGVSVWSSECFGDGLTKTRYAVADKLRAAPPLINSSATFSEILSDDENPAFIQTFNYSDIADSLSKQTRELVFIYPEAYETNTTTVPQALQLSALGASNGRAVFSPIVFDGVASGGVLISRGADYDKIVAQGTEITTAASTKNVATNSQNTISNPLGANLDYCWSHPKQNYRFLVSGEMRDNPSFSVGQTVRIPFGDFWAEMFFIKLDRSFNGGGRLSFEGIVNNITSEPVNNIDNVSGTLSLILRRTSTLDYNHNMDYIIRLSTDIQGVSTPPLTEPDVSVSGTITIPNHDPIIVNAEGGTTVEYVVGTISNSDWSDTTAQLSLTYGSQTVTVPLTKDNTYPTWDNTGWYPTYTNNTEANEPNDMVMFPAN